MVMVCPAAPVAGERDAMTGGPAGATGVVVVLEAGAAVVTVVELFGALLRELVVGAGDVGVVAWAERTGGAGGVDGPAVSETTNAVAAATTRTAAAATARISQRERAAGGGGGSGGRAVTTGSGAVGGPSAKKTVGASAGGATGGTGSASRLRWPSGGSGTATTLSAWGDEGGAGRGATPVDARARRTALSIAPRAR